MITDMLQKAFAKHHIETIDPSVKRTITVIMRQWPCNPATVSRITTSFKLCKRVQIKDRLLRAARVIVAKVTHKYIS